LIVVRSVFQLLDTDGIDAEEVEGFLLEGGGAAVKGDGVAALGRHGEGVAAESPANNVLCIFNELER
jgi:hypothetical protein